MSNNHSDWPAYFCNYLCSENVCVSNQIDKCQLAYDLEFFTNAQEKTKKHIRSLPGAEKQIRLNFLIFWTEQLNNENKVMSRNIDKIGTIKCIGIQNGMIKTWDGNIKCNYCMATDIPTFRNSSTSMHVQENRNLWWPCHRLSQKLERPSSWTTEIIISDQHCIIENYYSSQIFSHFAGIINQ